MPREVPNLGFSKLGRKGNGGWEAKKWKVEEHTDLGCHCYLKVQSEREIWRVCIVTHKIEGKICQIVYF